KGGGLKKARKIWGSWLGWDYETPLSQVRMGMVAGRKSGSERELSSVWSGLAGVPELRELRCAGGTPVPGSAGGAGVREACGEFLRVFRFCKTDVCGRKRGEKQRGSGA